MTDLRINEAVFANQIKKGTLKFQKTKAGLEISLGYEIDGKLDMNHFLYVRISQEQPPSSHKSKL